MPGTWDLFWFFPFGNSTLQQNRPCWPWLSTGHPVKTDCNWRTTWYQTETRRNNSKEMSSPTSSTTHTPWLVCEEAKYFEQRVEWERENLTRGIAFHSLSLFSSNFCERPRKNFWQFRRKEITASVFFLSQLTSHIQRLHNRDLLTWPPSLPPPPPARRSFWCAWGKRAKNDDW